MRPLSVRSIRPLTAITQSKELDERPLDQVTQHLEDKEPQFEAPEEAVIDAVAQEGEEKVIE